MTVQSRQSRSSFWYALRDGSLPSYLAPWNTGVDPDFDDDDFPLAGTTPHHLQDDYKSPRIDREL